ncbi:VWA domain-containing protein [Paenibacillus aurantius]|uniref:VWA domain-containing protein n=1 Tax=Paenibacillus aurantius TaxID=2918900 RepID=A0AA96LEU9_9BACL|nr:VWA domain-containing protein [Paenibacillus aurantius]WNQ11688.1 VWA domain-containing protein [Paenibacillus aurantius]
MKQILLITDGCSNVGISPVIAAGHALSEGIVVNVIGVIDQGEIGVLGSEEIGEIAKAGGGISRIVPSVTLSHTVQMMTRQTVAHTIRQAVNAELREIMGSGDVGELPPPKRAKIVAAMDDLSETAPLQVALLVDASASMKPKLGAVREAVRDLMASLQAREGKSELSVFHFPGRDSSEEIRMDADWTRELAKIPNLFYNLNMKGTTPTGPALLHTIRHFKSGGGGGSLPTVEDGLQLGSPGMENGEDGMLRDYIV